jgi:drug/metabolite transporter (DMT)-like permease
MTEQSHPLRAGIWMLGAVASFSFMAVAGREISVELNTFELMMYRSAIGFVIVNLLILKLGGYSQIKSDRLGMHLKRNIFHFAGQNLWFFGVSVIPLSQLVALEFTSPIWVILLAPFFLGEAMTKARAFAAVCGFIGVIIVAQPGVITLGAGHAAGALAAIFFALNVIYTRQISRFESVLSVVFWMTLMQFLLGLTLALPGGIPIPSAEGMKWVMIVAIAGLTAHYCLTSALSLAPAATVAPMEFIRLPVIALVGMAVYDEPFVWAVMVGGLFILGGNFINIRSERKSRRASP